MGNKISTHSISAEETTKLTIEGSAYIQSAYPLTIQFTNQVGSFQLLKEMKLPDGDVYITNNASFASTFIIVDSVSHTVTEELYMFDEDSISSNVSSVTGGGNAYYQGGELLLVMIAGEYYPLQENYSNHSNGRPTSINAFSQYSSGGFSQSNLSNYRFSDEGIIAYDREGAISGDYAVEVDSNMSYMAVKDNYTGEWVSDKGEFVDVINITPQWKRISKSFTISMLGEVTVYWAIDSSDTKFVSEVLDLPVGNYVMSKFVNQIAGTNIISTTNITNTSSLQVPFTSKGRYSGSTVKIKADNKTMNKATITYGNDSTTDITYNGVELVIPYNSQLIKSVRFYKE